MIRVLLIRTLQCADGTFGHLLTEDFHAVTAEPEAPRKGNKGRIPSGTYHCLWEPYGKFRGYALKDVPGFKDVEIHIGNREEDTTGCILLGRRRGKVWKAGKAKEGILGSGVMMTRFAQHMKQQSFDLVISEEFDDTA